MLYYNNVSQDPFVQSLLREIDKHINDDHVHRVTEVKDKEHYLLLKNSSTKKKIKILFNLTPHIEIKIMSKVLNIPENICRDYRCVTIINTTTKADVASLGKELAEELNTNSEYVSNVQDGKPSKILFVIDPKKLNETNVYASVIHSVNFVDGIVRFTLDNNEIVDMTYDDLSKIRVPDNNYMGKWYVKNSEGLVNILASAKFKAMFTNRIEESHEERIYSN